MADLMRFSVAIPEDLLIAFDAYVAKRGIAKNRSEVIRDLIRDALIDDEWDIPGQEVIGTLTIVFSGTNDSFHANFEAIKRENCPNIISSTRSYIDESSCIEVLILRGSNDMVTDIANTILGLKGIKHGHLTTTTTGKFI